MKTLIDIPDNEAETLSTICKAKGLSRAEAVRRAIRIFIEQNRMSPHFAFGLWHNKSEDGLDYQNRMRSEW
jgi:hypothetical protein